jgi:hypothetical protein
MPTVESVPVTPDAETRLRDHPDLAATAFHESGHAVAALRHGIILESVDVVYTPDRFGAADYKHEHAPRETRALCLLAAGAAERRYTGSRRAHDAGDVNALRALFQGSALDPDRPMRSGPRARTRSASGSSMGGTPRRRRSSNANGCGSSAWHRRSNAASG